jgi:hypothetical protein
VSYLFGFRCAFICNCNFTLICIKIIKKTAAGERARERESDRERERERERDEI